MSNGDGREKGEGAKFHINPIQIISYVTMHKIDGFFVAIVDVVITVPFSDDAWCFQRSTHNKPFPSDLKLYP